MLASFDSTLQDYVLTVPMRNGNSATSWVIRYDSYVLTVPMRNGNYAVNCSCGYSHLRSYRTYEEWKLPERLVKSIRYNVLTVPMRNGNIEYTSIVIVFDIGSYRTYEEWKLSSVCKKGLSYTVFLPYL